MIPFLDVAGLNAQCEPELSQAAQRVRLSGHYILGPELEAFELALAESQGVRQAIGVGNGLDALALTLMGLGIGPGDEVIVPAHTFIATWLAVAHVGASVIPVDISANSYNLDASLLESAVTPRTAAIVPVHLYGNPADMQTIERFADRHQLAVVADGAQSIGATYRGLPVSSFARATTLSFYPAKNLGALGDGGAVLTDDLALADRIRSLRNYGSHVKYVHESMGVNSRLDEIQAAFLRVKLGRLEVWNQRRREIAQRYLVALRDADVVLPMIEPDSVPVWHLFVVRSERRDRLMQRLGDQSIPTLIHYPTPPARQAAFADASLPGFPVADMACARVLSLPMCPTLTDAQVDRVAEELLAAL